MTNNNRLATAAEAAVSAGPLGNLGERGDEYEAFCDAAFGRGKELRRKQTSCAVFVGCCFFHAGLKPRRRWPRINGITTWAGVSWFSAAWVPYKPGVDLLRGDILYWCGNTPLGWKMALNGHVGILLEGSGHMWRTAEGGGSPGGTMCRMSVEPKDIRFSGVRPLRGVWRPDEMTLLAPGHEPQAASFVPIKYGARGRRVSEWQLLLLQHGQRLPVYGVDGDFGGETLAATRAFQVTSGLLPTGDVNEETWDAAK